MKSPWGYKKWRPETYIAFHALRTYTAITCVRQNGEAVISLRVIRTRTKSVVSSNELKAAFREFMRRYSDAIIAKKKNYIVVDCKKFFGMDAKALSYIARHGEIKRLEEIDDGLKKIFDWLFTE